MNKCVKNIFVDERRIRFRFNKKLKYYIKNNDKFSYIKNKPSLNFIKTYTIFNEKDTAFKKNSEKGKQKINRYMW